MFSFGIHMVRADESVTVCGECDHINITLPTIRTKLNPTDMTTIRTKLNPTDIAIDNQAEAHLLYCVEKNPKPYRDQCRRVSSSSKYW